MISEVLEHTRRLLRHVELFQCQLTLATDRFCRPMVSLSCVRVSTVLSGAVAASDHQGQQRIMPQLFVIIEVFVPRSNPHHPLPQQQPAGV